MMAEPVTGEEMTQFQKVSIDQIDVTDLQMRSSLGDLSEMTASIKSRGVQEPVLVKKTAQGRFELFVGNRRLEASKLAEATDIPAIVYSRRAITRQGMLELNLLENVQRDDLNPIDEARGYEKLKKDFNLEDDELCEKVGIKKKRLKSRMRLLKMTDVVQEALLHDRISLKSASEIDRLPKDLQGKYVRIAEDLKGARIEKLVNKELDKIAKKAEGEGESEKPPVDDQKEFLKTLIRTIRSAGQVVANGLGYDDEEKQKLKDVNFRALDVDDVQVVAKTFDDLADLVPDNIDVNEKAEKEIISAVEGPRALNVEWPAVRQGLIAMVMERAQEIAIEKAKDKNKRPKVTFAISKEAIEEFFDSE